MPDSSEDSGSPVLWEEIDGVGVVSLNRPQAHNAINNALYDGWERALDWAERTSSVRAVLLCGNGPSFSSGRDRADIGAPPAGVSLMDYTERSQKLRLKQIELKKPIVAAIHGHTLGAGAQLALGADFRIGADDLRFALPETNFGLVVDTGASVLLTLLIGPARAKWMLMSGERVDAENALNWGLIEWIAPKADLRSRALEIAAKLAGRSSEALTHTKALVDATWTSQFREGLRRELLSQTLLFGSAEHLAIRAKSAQ